MQEALAQSIAETAADALGSRTTRPRAKVSDKEIGLYLWHERGFRDHDTLVSLINHTRIALDRPQAKPSVQRGPETSRRRDVVAVSQPVTPRSETSRRREALPPVQLAFDLVTP